MAKLDLTTISGTSRLIITQDEGDQIISYAADIKATEKMYRILYLNKYNLQLSYDFLVPVSTPAPTEKSPYWDKTIELETGNYDSTIYTSIGVYYDGDVAKIDKAAFQFPRYFDYAKFEAPLTYTVEASYEDVLNTIRSGYGYMNHNYADSISGGTETFDSIDTSFGKRPGFHRLDLTNRIFRGMLSSATTGNDITYQAFQSYFTTKLSSVADFGEKLYGMMNSLYDINSTFGSQTPTTNADGEITFTGDTSLQTTKKFKDLREILAIVVNQFESYNSTIYSGLSDIFGGEIYPASKMEAYYSSDALYQQLSGLNGGDFYKNLPNVLNAKSIVEYIKGNITFSSTPVQDESLVEQLAKVTNPAAFNYGYGTVGNAQNIPNYAVYSASHQLLVNLYLGFNSKETIFDATLNWVKFHELISAILLMYCDMLLFEILITLSFANMKSIHVFKDETEQNKFKVDSTNMSATPKIVSRIDNITKTSTVYDTDTDGSRFATDTSGFVNTSAGGFAGLYDLALLSPISVSSVDSKYTYLKDIYQTNSLAYYNKSSDIGAYSFGSNFALPIPIRTLAGTSPIVWNAGVSLFNKSIEVASPFSTSDFTGTLDTNYATYLKKRSLTANELEVISRNLDIQRTIISDLANGEFADPTTGLIHLICNSRLDENYRKTISSDNKFTLIEDLLTKIKTTPVAKSSTDTTSVAEKIEHSLMFISTIVDAITQANVFDTYVNTYASQYRSIFTPNYAGKILMSRKIQFALDSIRLVIPNANKSETDLTKLTEVFDSTIIAKINSPDGYSYKYPGALDYNRVDTYMMNSSFGGWDDLWTRLLAIDKTFDKNVMLPFSYTETKTVASTSKRICTNASFNLYAKINREQELQFVESSEDYLGIKTAPNSAGLITRLQIDTYPLAPSGTPAMEVDSKQSTLEDYIGKTDLCIPFRLRSKTKI